MDIEVKMPDIGLDEVEVIEILVKINEKIKLEQGLITVEGDKTSMEIPSPICGIVKKINVNIGDKIQTSSLIMICESNNENNFVKPNKIDFLKEKQTIKEEKISSYNSNNINLKKNIFVHATPMIRRLARHLDIDLNNVTGTGRKNRILKEDVEEYQKNYQIKHFKEDNKIHDINNNQLKIEEIKLSRLQRITGSNLCSNWVNIPHVTQFDEANISILEKFRKKYNNENKINNNNITILVFILKIVASALKKFPIFNSSLTSDNKKIILKKYINIGVAVDVGDGLLVPVVKNVNKKSIEELSSELIILSEKARKKTLTLFDTSDGCFTISNLGGIGGSWFSPIINAPEVAILGVSRSQIKPLWNGKEFIPSLMLPLSLSYDHRVINGADAARFITFIVKLLSDIHFLVM